MKRYLVFVLISFISFNLFAFSDMRIKMYPKECTLGDISDSRSLENLTYNYFEIKDNIIYVYELSESDEEEIYEEGLDYSELEPLGKIALYKVGSYSNNCIYNLDDNPEDGDKYVSTLYSYMPGELSFIFNGEDGAFDKRVYTINTKTKDFVSYQLFAGGVLLESVEKNNEKKYYEYKAFSYPYVNEHPESANYNYLGGLIRNVILDFNNSYKEYRKITSDISKMDYYYEYDSEKKIKKITMEYFEYITGNSTHNSEDGYYIKFMSIGERKINPKTNREEIMPVSQGYYYYDLNMELIKKIK